MAETDSFIELIDKHLHHHSGFAICRLPGTDAPIMYIQTDGEPELTYDLSRVSDKSGFVIAPYDASELPAVIIRPDIKAYGNDEIISSLRTINIGQTVTAQQLPTYDITHEEYTQLFDKYTDSIKKGENNKIVFARSSSRALAQSPAALFCEACRRYTNLFVYMAFTRTTGLWLGCSPELLVEGGQGKWRTMALAGTQKLTDNVVWDEKNKAEQHIVEEFITAVLKPMSADIGTHGPYTYKAAQLAHLCTDIEFVTPDTTSIGDIARLLHPTPAVCGMPRETARQFIQRYEPTRRLYYSGVVGLTAPQADSHLYVNLRCMNICGPTATIFAGGGIMADSQCESEWNETEMKIATIDELIK
ncbi:MAG: isochorismate synthase [Bacteroidales bacterium]|nr:isochorismate synthase [Bacteroidales bacterium]